ncbi:MAG: hypothetical protein ACRDYX_07915 [Egibacteraceae bacterium]
MTGSPDTRSAKPEESLAAGMPGAELVALRLRLEAVNLRGLAEVADALLGDCPAAVCEVLASWDLAQSGELPSLVDPCWAALAPLEVGAPAGRAPEVLEGLLAGLHAEEQVALDALGECADRADRVPACLALPPASDALDGELWRRALVWALDDFWALTNDICARARLVLLRRDHAETARFLQLERVTLEEVTERISALVDCMVSADWARLDPTEQATALSAGPLLIDRRPLTPVEEARRWLPIVFLAAVTGLAIVVLVTVAYSSPPG